MNEFLNVGKSLEIKEISKDIEAPGNEPPDDVQSNEFEKEIVLPNPEADLQQLSEINAMKKKPINSSQRNIAQDRSLLSCNDCEKQFSRQSGLFQHKKSIHKGLKYPCKQCNFTASQKVNLQRHINIIHEGVKYPRDQCSYKASTKSNLQRHINSTHEG